ncbi:MAG: DNA primase [Caulobacter sp.]|nr:DNA primase [Caulobacter sp.]
MRFDDRFLEEIKSRVRLSDVIGKTVKLKRQGREFVGLSPFTKERSPSFFVNDDKGFFHDFSSGKHGDLISFFQETERLSFMEAVERLAAEAGVPLPAPDPQAAEQEKKRQGLSDWMDLAAAWFEGELGRPAGREARAYLERRGLPETEWKRFGLGYAPSSRTGLKDYLIAKGARPAELVEAGLLIAPEDGGAPFDRYRDRIIFPIADARGRVVSFGGRALDPNARAKYLNGPETTLFHKGRLLYGLPEARKLLHSGGADAALVVVEGYMDAIACQRAGIAAVAPLGTALTEDQMEVLWRLHPEPTLSFDGDSAGRRAANSAIDRALPLIKPGKSFRFAIVVGGKDPDDVLREQGPAALKAQLADTTPFVEQLFHRERDLEPLDTPERRAGLKVRLRKLAASIADPDLSQAYREDLLGRYEQLWPTSQPVFTVGAAAREMSRRRWDGKGRATGPIGPNAETREQVSRMRNSPRPLSAALALAALQDPHVLDDKVEQLSVRGFCDDRLSALANELVEFRFESDAVDAISVRRRLEARGFGEDVFQQLAHTARAAGAAFLAADLEPARARRLWSMAFDLLVKLETLERAVEGAKQDLERDNDSSTFMRLKSERDLLKRLVDSGGWSDEAEAAAWLN